MPTASCARRLRARRSVISARKPRRSGRFSAHLGWYWPVLDSREYLRGRWGEVIQLALLQSFDWSVLAACDYSGPGGDRAPRLHGACEIIVPDFDAAKLGVRA